MLIIDVALIPAEGQQIAVTLDPARVHLEGEESFRLEAGAALNGQLERGEDDAVHLRGHLGARLGLECGRCLEPFGFPLDQELDLFYLPHREGQAEEEEEEVGLSDRDVVVGYYRDGRLDLGEVVREQLILALPMRRLCREDCKGLCPSCGVNLNQTQCSCAPAVELDPRLAGLARLLDKNR